MKIQISSGSIRAIADLKDTPTAKAIYNSLPIEGATAYRRSSKQMGR